MKSEKIFFTWLIPGIWILWIFKIGINIHNVILPVGIAITGASVMITIGYMMDRAKFNRKIWTTIFALGTISIFIFVLSQFPSLKRAISKNGSIMAYILPSINVGIYISVILSSLLAWICWIWKTCRSGQQNSP